MQKNQLLDKLEDEIDKISQTEDQRSANVLNNLKLSDRKTKSSASEMSEFLSAVNITIPKVGDVITGKIIEKTPSAIYLELGNMGTGIVLGKEIKDGLGLVDKLKVGDYISATVIDLENEDGFIELSIRQASIDKAWQNLQEKQEKEEVFTTKILDANKGGLIVEVNGITGFLPVSQLSSEHYPRIEDGDKAKILEKLKSLVNQELKVKIIDTDRETEKLIVSEKAAYSDKERQAVSELKVGDVVEGEISGVVDFGAFVKFLPPSKKDTGKEEEKLEGLVHISELAWQLIDDPREIIKTGDKVRCKIIGIDDTRVSLSMKALAKDPWSEISKRYKVGDVVKGVVKKINHFGAFVYLDEDIHGLAHVSELTEKNLGKSIEDIIKVGSEYQWKILSIEPKDHRMGLSLVSM